MMSNFSLHCDSQLKSTGDSTCQATTGNTLPVAQTTLHSSLDAADRSQYYRVSSTCPEIVGWLTSEPDETDTVDPRRCRKILLSMFWWHHRCIEHFLPQHHRSRPGSASALDKARSRLSTHCSVSPNTQRTCGRTLLRRRLVSDREAASWSRD